MPAVGLVDLSVSPCTGCLGLLRLLLPGSFVGLVPADGTPDGRPNEPVMASEMPGRPAYGSALEAALCVRARACEG